MYNEQLDQIEQLDPLSTVEQRLTETLALRDSLAMQAKALCDDYWGWFTEQNSKISHLRKVGETTHHCSKVAPVVERKKYKTQDGHVESVYICWKIHSKTFRKRLGPTMGKGKNPSLNLHRYAVRDVRSTLEEKLTWDKKRALALESKFILLRQSIDGLQKAASKLRNTRKQLIRLQTQLTHFQQQEREHAC